LLASSTARSSALHLQVVFCILYAVVSMLYVLVSTTDR
jgi:hypothetical protein